MVSENIVIQEQKPKRVKKPKQKKRPGMSDLGDYVDFRYLPDLALAARKIIFPNQPKNIADQNEFLVYFSFKTGRRPQELVETKVMDYDPTNQEINFHIMKKRTEVESHQRIPIDKETAEMLELYIKRMGLQRDHYLFSWLRYGVKKKSHYIHMDRRTAWRIISAASQLSGIKAENGKDICPRIIRHSFAVHLAKIGKPLNVIKDFLCHSDIAITAIYTQFSKKQLKKEIDDAFKK